MLRTIHEKEKVTLVQKRIEIPLLMAGIALASFALGFLLIPERTIVNMTLLAVGPILLLIVAYQWSKKRQVIVIDGNRQTIEEYRGKHMRTFDFADIRWADVERAKEEKEEVETIEDSIEDLPENDSSDEIPSPPTESLIKPTAKTKSLHLNYHPFLQLHSGQKYFLFDNKGRGIKNYRHARKIIEIINRYVGVGKVTSEKLNVYQIRSSRGVTRWLMALIVLALVAAASYGIFRLRGV